MSITDESGSLEQEGNHGQLEVGVLVGPDGHPSLAGDAPRHEQLVVELPFGVDLDHHFEPRLNHARGYVGVRRLGQGALIQLRQDRSGLGRDRRLVRLLVVNVEGGDDFGDVLAAGFGGEHEDAKQRLAVGD